MKVEVITAAPEFRPYAVQILVETPQDEEDIRFLARPAIAPRFAAAQLGRLSVAFNAIYPFLGGRG